MSTDWQSFIGDYTRLRGNGISAFLAKQYTLACTKFKDDYVQQKNLVEDEGDSENKKYFEKFETFEQGSIKFDKKTNPKPTYLGIKKSKDEETGLVDESEQEIPIKKFVCPSIEVKAGFLYLLNAYIHEFKKFYDDKQGRLPEESQLNNAVRAHSFTAFMAPVFPFITTVAEMLPIDNVISGDIAGAEAGIKLNTMYYFKPGGGKNMPPDGPIRFILENFLRFINFVSMITTPILTERRCAANMVLLFIALRQINSIVRLKDPRNCLIEDVFINIREYALITKETTSATNSKKNASTTSKKAGTKKKAPTGGKKTGKKAGSNSTKKTTSAGGKKVGKKKVDEDEPDSDAPEDDEGGNPDDIEEGLNNAADDDDVQNEDEFQDD